MAIDFENDFPSHKTCFVITFWDKDELDHLCLAEPHVITFDEVKAKMKAYVKKKEAAQN